MKTTDSPRMIDLELMPMREVMRMTGATARSTIYYRLRHDHTFPKPRRVGSQSVAWLRSEVEDWIRSLPVARSDGLGATRARVM